MIKSLYSKKTLSHFRRPHNFGEIRKASVISEVGNVVCGDVMTLYLKIGKNKNNQEVIEDIKFKTYGCVAAIATSSVVTDLAKGRSIEEALKITKERIIKVLEGLPPIKIHCSILAVEALKEAIYQYFLKNKKPIPKELEEQHRLIEESKRIIETRQKEWLKLQGKLKLINK